MRQICMWICWTTMVGHGKECVIPYDIQGAKDFLVVILYMGMKRLLNMKSFWAKSKKIFYCSIILGLFTRKKVFCIDMLFACK